MVEIRQREKFRLTPWFLTNETEGTVVPLVGLGNMVGWVEEVTIVRELLPSIILLKE